ncbi:MAG TPA: redoxin domain-containing protein [Patescibacteria group bacterium]|nr:redoxin domain-containing protein [Patescibacteria group bacterium]
MKTRIMVLAAVLAAVVSIAAVRGAGSEGGAAAEAQKIRTQLQDSRQAMTPYAYIDLAERLWIGFLDKYPSEPEAAEAHLTLGFIYAQTQRNEKAVHQLEAYRDMEGAKRPSDEAKALVTLAGGYMELERYNDAEVVLKQLTKPSSGRDHRISQMASQQLARLGSLRKLKIGLPAISFSAQTAAGKPIKLEDYRGKVVLLDFWASWCAPCRKEMPNVKKVYANNHAKGFEIIGISLDDKESKFKEYMESEQMPWPQIFDGKGWQSELGQLYAVSAIPATYLLDREGKIRYKNMRGGDLERTVQELLGEK